MSELAKGARLGVVSWRLVVGVALMMGGAIALAVSQLSSEPESSIPNISTPQPAQSASEAPPTRMPDDVLAGLGLTLRRLDESDKAYLRTERFLVYRRGGARIVKATDYGFKANDILLGPCGTRDIVLFDLLLGQTWKARKPWCFRVLRRGSGETGSSLLEIGEVL